MKKFSSIARRILSTIPPTEQNTLAELTEAVNEVKKMDFDLEDKMLTLFSALNSIVSPQEAKGWQVDMYSAFFRIDKNFYSARVKELDKHYWALYTKNR